MAHISGLLDWRKANQLLFVMPPSQYPEGIRDRVILVVGGPRISHELAKELGYDAGFGTKSYAEDVASFALNCRGGAATSA